ncbi:MAG: hypothetical protein ACT4PL_06955 [Phycisphaerales bacterium]
MTRKKTEPREAGEFMEQLLKDPAYVAMRAKQDAERAAIDALLDADEASLLTDLRAVGEHVDSAYHYVNKTDAPPAAIPVLVKHLDIPHDPRVLDGIVRALTVKHARGAPARALLSRLLRSTDPKEEFVRWSILNALTVCGDASMIPALEKFDWEAMIPSYRDRIVKEALRACKRNKGPYP